MKIQLITDRRELVEIPLAGDPSVAQANGILEITTYRYSDSDVGNIEIPDDATLVRFKPVQRVDLRNAETMAGRVPAKGQRLFVTGRQRALAAHTTEVRAAALEGRLPDLSTFDEVWASYLDSLDDDEARAVTRYEAWQHRRAQQIVRRAVDSILIGHDDDGGELRIDAKADGFPVDLFEAAADVSLRNAQREHAKQQSRAIVAAQHALRDAMAAVEDREAVVAAVSAGNVADVPQAVLDALRADEDARRGAWRGAASGAELIDEMADHVERVSSLGKGGRPCSSSPSGGATATTSRPAGTAASA